VGPLEGQRIIEVGGIGPVPYCAMLLADLGAEVVRVARPDPGLFAGNPARDALDRGRRCIGLDLKRPEGACALLRMLECADGLIEGFRPGVMERLGLGPEICLERNPRLVYGRLSGFGQEGPLANTAGHDINYLAFAGALAHIGRSGQPPALPLNLVADFGGGGLFLALGLVCALLERERSGRGQVVDAAMVDGVAHLMSMFHAAQQAGAWRDERGSNLLDGGAPFYDVYETADGKHVAVGALEPQFYAELLAATGLADSTLPPQFDRDGWPVLRRRLAEVFRTRTRDAWCEIMAGRDVCFAPVLSMAEARRHAHQRAREAYVEVGGSLQPRPAPRFSRTEAHVPRPAAQDAEHTDAVLADWGFSRAEIAALREAGAAR
jgi:alpha-methylacyl-CoA racemase